MACIDFGLTSFCSQVSNIAIFHGNPQNFLTWQLAGYNHPAFGGCQWFTSKISDWSNTLANTNSVGQKRQLTAKIDWANCMLNVCCGQGGLVVYGCMDDGTRGNDYLNNQGTWANPQFGSVTPGTPALNYSGGNTIDDGICIYSYTLTSGCKDPAATNYDPNADMDCDGNYVSDFNINYTSWQGTQPPGTWTPYGDTSCCTYEPPPTNINYNYRYNSCVPNYQPWPGANTTCWAGNMGAVASVSFYSYTPSNWSGVSTNIQQGVIGGQGIDYTGRPSVFGGGRLRLYLSRYDVRLNVANPAYNPGTPSGGNYGWHNENGPHNPIATIDKWKGSNPGPSTQYPSNPYKITIYDLEENKVGAWTYTDVYSVGNQCYNKTTCTFAIELGNPIPDPGSPTTFDCGVIPPPPIGDYAFTTPTAFQTALGAPCGWSYGGPTGTPTTAAEPYYVLVECLATNEIMSSPLGNGVGNTANLTNYAGTGVDMRFIDSGTGAARTPTQDFLFHKLCCGGGSGLQDNCDFYRYYSELPPSSPPLFECGPYTWHTGPGLAAGWQVNVPQVDMQLVSGCAAAKLICTSLPALPPPPSAKLGFGGNDYCQVNDFTIKSTYNNDENQIVEIRENLLLDTQENEKETILTFNGLLDQNSTKNIFNITFKTKDGYYYSKSPSLNMNFPGMENYKIKVESESKNARGYVTEKTFNINYKNTGFDVFEEDGHNIIFTTKIVKEVDTSTETQVKEITALSIDTSSVGSSGESRNISVVGTPGSTFSLTIKDKNGRNVLPYSGKITKTIKTAISASNTLELNNTTGLEVGMIVLNGQRRNVKITGISDVAKTNVDAINETSTTYISISSHLTFAADASITFTKEIDITEVAIPDSGAYSFIQEFPPLEKFKRTLKTAASATTSLTLDYTDDLENDMRITGTGVDGNNPTIGLTKLSTTQGVDPDGVTISVSDAQTIADETELTFEMPDNRYDITLYPLMAILGDGVPRYSSTDCDTLPTYSIYQYIDPIVEIAPATSALSNVTTAGTITLTGKANRGVVGTSGDITINMTATKSDGNLATSRAPRFSSIDSESSDFSNTLNTVTKRVREGDCNDRDIVHLNNVAGIRVGMIVTGGDINTNKTITVKSITGTAVKLSEKQTIQKDDMLTFSSMFNMHISGLTATLSPNGGQATGICTIAGTGKITTFGIDSFTSTFAFDNFLSIPG